MNAITKFEWAGDSGFKAPLVKETDAPFRPDPGAYFAYTVGRLVGLPVKRFGPIYRNESHGQIVTARIEADASNRRIPQMVEQQVQTGQCTPARRQIVTGYLPAAPGGCVLPVPLGVDFCPEFLREMRLIAAMMLAYDPDTETDLARSYFTETERHIETACSILEGYPYSAGERACFQFSLMYHCLTMVGQHKRGVYRGRARLHGGFSTGFPQATKTRGNSLEIHQENP